jgi:hypothetical protein
VRADPRRAGTDPVVLEDAPFSDATRIDVPGRFSPDGSSIAFVSDRSGRSEVWVARRDGSNLRTVAAVENASLALGGFSPDGASIVFSATLGGSSDLYVVDLASGDIRRLTRSNASEFDPEWSRDGRWIYYVAEIPDDSRSPSIWKMPAAGGAAVRLTAEPGFDPREAADGRAVYFMDSRRLYSSSAVGTLKQVPAGGGAVTTVISRVTPGSWDVTDAGIVMLRERHAPYLSGPDGLLLYDPASGKTRELGNLAFHVSAFGPTRYLVASRDAAWVLASHIDRWERDIIIVDGVE